MKLALRDFYEEEIGYLLAERQRLLAYDDDAHDKLAEILGERIKELIQKMEELK